MTVERNHIYNADCMDGMAEMPDNYVDLAIVDPPYGIDVTKMTLGSGPKDFKRGEWDDKIPDESFFSELSRVSTNQIIWGGNYFTQYEPPSRCWVVWDKDVTGDFADCELAWTSFDKCVKKFFYPWSGFRKGNISKDKQTKMHPTQKPIDLYKWLLSNYAKEGDLILDTHMGSGSSYIAALDLGFDYIGYEIDADYFKGIEDRVYHFTRQRALI